MAALALVGCGSDAAATADGDSTAPAASSAPMFDRLPEKYQKSPTITVGSDIAYAPVEFFDTDGKTVIGLDPDLAAAMSKQLGVTFVFENQKFDNLIPQLKTGAIDVIMSAMNSTAKRQAEADFVEYFTAGSSIMVKKGNPEKIATLDDLCGRTVSVQKGTTSEDILNRKAPTCESAGKGKLTILSYPTDPEAQLQVTQGRAVADVSDFPVAAFAAKKNPDAFEVVGDQIEAGPYGIAVAKDNAQLRDAIRAALEATVTDGTYAAALNKWGVTSGGVTKITVNGS
jgi:polar amino acid transport system substrate-binding protein